MFLSIYSCGAAISYSCKWMFKRLKSFAELPTHFLFIKPTVEAQEKYSMWNLLKIVNKYTRTTSLRPSVVFIANVEQISHTVSIVDFVQVNAVRVTSQYKPSSLTQFRPKFHLRINQVVGFY